MRIEIHMVLCCTLALTASAAGGETLPQVLARMDGAAKAFRGMTVDTKKLTYTAVIDDRSEENGVLRMRRIGGHDVQALWETTQPVQKTWEFRGSKARLFLPKVNQVEIFDFSKNGDQMDQFVLLGFGTPADELQKNYSIRLIGQENSASHIELTPKSPQALNLVKKVELWISNTSNYPVREKLLEPSGDYVLVTYDNLKLSPVPAEKDVELKLPSRVQKIYPGK
ncbi:MAG: LolA family protein [Bryobacteraceae bacterium]